MAEFGALMIAMLLSAGAFHTPPECWPEPRYTHRPSSAEFSDRVTLMAAQTTQALDGEYSPNHGYQYSVSHADSMALVRIDVEHGRQWLLSLRGAAWQPEVRWVNEKLLYVRVHWGRVLASDLLIDVEAGELLWQELADNGEIAHQQFQQACGGNCPCQTEQQISHPAPPPVDQPPLLGLAEVPAINAGVEVLPEPLWVRAEPTADAPARSISRLRDFATRELGYEQPGLLVYGVRPGWLQVALASGDRVWIAADAARLHPVELLVINRLNYLSRNWDGRLWERPGGALAQTLEPEPGQETSAHVITAERFENRSWLQIEVHQHSPCEGGGEPTVIARGWVPAHRTDGEPLVWFHSRGC